MVESREERVEFSTSLTIGEWPLQTSLIPDRMKENQTNANKISQHYQQYN